MACEYHILMIPKSALSINPGVLAKNRTKTVSSHPHCPFIISTVQYLSQSLWALSQYFMSLAHLLEQTKYYITLEEHRCPESTQARMEVYPYCLFYLNGLLDIWNSVIWSALLLYRCIQATIIICGLLYYPVYNCYQDILHNHNIILHSQVWLLMVSVVQQMTWQSQTVLISSYERCQTGIWCYFL